jgi:hypothetical protein
MVALAFFLSSDGGEGKSRRRLKSGNKLEYREVGKTILTIRRRYEKIIRSRGNGIVRKIKKWEGMT